jgi:hypothetical protein
MIPCRKGAKDAKENEESKSSSLRLCAFAADILI